MGKPPSLLYVSGIYIKHSSERINVSGHGFPSHSASTAFAKTNCSYSSCPLMSFSKFILTWELKMKWKPAAFIIIVLSFPPFFPQFLLHIGVIRFTSFLKQWFTFPRAHWDLFISIPYIKHVLQQVDAAMVSQGCTVIHNKIKLNRQSPNVLCPPDILALLLKEKRLRRALPLCCRVIRIKLLSFTGVRIILLIAYLTIYLINYISLKSIINYISDSIYCKWNSNQSKFHCDWWSFQSFMLLL